MAASPQWKIYCPNEEYRAACKYLEEAACLVAFLGDGSTIRSGHHLILWREGSEDQPASESYDHVVMTINERLRDHDKKFQEKCRGRRG